MPKKQEQQVSLDIQNWDDVDKALLEIAESEITLTGIEAQMNIEINAAKEKATSLASPLQVKIKALETLVKSFVTSNKNDIDGKTKILNFGKVGFRQSSRVSVPIKIIDQIIQNLKNHGMQDCITTKETINKEVLEKYSDKDIAKVGASKKYEDKFFMETDKKKVRP